MNVESHENEIRIQQPQILANLMTSLQPKWVLVHSAALFDFSGDFTH